MSYLPARDPWPAAVSGDTLPASEHHIGGNPLDLAAVQFLVSPRAGGPVLFRLDSGSTGGIIILQAAAPEWQFRIAPIPRIPREPGTDHDQLKTTDTGGTHRTELEGDWQIAPFPG